MHAISYLDNQSSGNGRAYFGKINNQLFNRMYYYNNITVREDIIIIIIENLVNIILLEVKALLNKILFLSIITQRKKRKSNLMILNYAHIYFSYLNAPSHINSHS